MRHLDPVPGMQAFGHDRAVARFGIRLDAEQARRPPLGQVPDQQPEIGAIEDLSRVPLPVGRCKFGPRSFTHPAASVLGVLELPEFGGRCQLRMVAVADLRSRQGLLEAQRIRPCVLWASHPSALAKVEQYPHLSVSEGVKKGLEIPFVDTDRAHALHLVQGARTPVHPDTMTADLLSGRCRAQRPGTAGAMRAPAPPGQARRARVRGSDRPSSRRPGSRSRLTALARCQVARTLDPVLTRHRKALENALLAGSNRGGIVLEAPAERPTGRGPIVGQRVELDPIKDTRIGGLRDS